MRVRLEFRPDHFWVGASWRVGGETRHYVAGTAEYRVRRRVDLWVCLLPTLPIHVTWHRNP